jgi:hypothetical protein
MNIDIEPQSGRMKLNLTSLILYVLAIKAVIFLIDPTVMFFLDDSSRYLDTAISSYIAPDRSFLYGYLIRWLTFTSQSLTSLVVFQVLCSAASSVLAGYILNKFLFVKPAVATFVSLLCALAPLQLFYERYVLTEAVSLLFFALFVTIGFCYLRHPKIRTLFVLGLAGVFLIAFRLSYLPCVFIGAVVVPALVFFSSDNGRNRSNAGGSWIRRIGNRKRVCIHIVISCLFTYGLHYGYKLINGTLSNNRPAYQYRTGDHLLASWAPLLEEVDFSDPGIAGYYDSEYLFDLKDRFQRMNHRWSQFGLVGYMVQLYGSRAKANEAAYATAMNILHRNPLGIIGLAIRSYADYWNIALLKENLLMDRSGKEYPAPLIEILKSHYHISAEGFGFRETLTNQYFFNAIPWFMVLFSLPLVIAIVLFIDNGQRLIPLALLGSYGLLLLINSTVLIHRNTMRFFHPAEWITLVFLGVFFNRIARRKLISPSV